MGNYASTAELIARFEDTSAAAFATDAGEVGTPDTDVLNEVINDAESVIDGYVGVRHIVPVVVAGDTVLANRMRSLTLDIARYKLDLRGDYVSDARAAAYEAAIKWLEGVSTGKIMLPAAAAQATTASNTPDATWGIAGETVSGTSQRLFSRETQERL